MIHYSVLPEYKDKNVLHSRIQQIKVNNDADVLEQINSANLLHQVIRYSNEIIKVTNPTPVCKKTKMSFQQILQSCTVREGFLHLITLGNI